MRQQTKIFLQKRPHYMYFLKLHTLAFMFTTLTYAKCMRTGHMVYC